MGSVYRILTVIGVIAIIYFINTNFINKKFDQWLAKSPDIHLNTARRAADKNALEKCIHEIEIAIKDMEKIEQFSDSVSMKMIEKAIIDLKNVKKNLEHDSINISVLNLVFAKSINTLAYTYLKISDDDLVHGHEIRAIGSLKVVIDHLYNSMGFLNKKNIEEERIIVNQIYNVIDSLKSTNTINHERIELIFAEINQLIIEEENKLYEIYGNSNKLLITDSIK